MREALREEEVAEGRALRRGALHRTIDRGQSHVEAQRTHHVGHHVIRLLSRVAERANRWTQRLVGDLEVTTTRELLELHEREVGLDARRVAVHEKTDGARWRDDGGLRVAETKLLAVTERIIPACDRAIEKISGVRQIDAAVRDERVVDRHWTNAKVLILVAGACHTHRGATVIAHDAQHRLAVLRVAREGAMLSGEECALSVGTACEHRGEHAAHRATFFAVVWNARLHEHRAEVRVTKAERAVAPREISDFLRRERCHEHRHLEDDRPEADCVLVAFNIEATRLCVVELHEVDRREIAGRVVEEHVLGARIARVDTATRGARVPRVDGRVVLNAWIGATPCGEVDFRPEFLRLDRLRNLAVGAASEVPISVSIERVEEFVGDTDGVVRVLSADGVVRLTVEVVIELEAVLLREFLLIFAENLQAFDKCRDLDFFACLPANELHHIRVIEIKADHLRGATRGAARLDGAGGTIADLEEAHEARTLAAARERLVLTTALREIGTGAGSELEEASFSRPKIHDAALADEVVLHGLDEAGVRLRMGVCVGCELRRARAVISEPVTLCWSLNAVSPVEAGVKPLRAVRRRHLREQHVGELIVKRFSISLRREVAVLLTPVRPATRKAVHDLAH